MLQRWFLMDFRYRSIWATFETAATRLDVARCGLFLDISLRPLFAVHVASIWNGFPRCIDCAIVITSFASIAITTDLLVAGDTCAYPAPGFPGALDLARRIWAYSISECRVHAIWIRGRLSRRYGILTQGVKTAFRNSQHLRISQHWAGASQNDPSYQTRWDF